MSDAPEDLPTLAPGSSPYQRHVFVCISGKTCPDQGGMEVRDALRVAAMERLGKTNVRVNKAGCLDQCARGTTCVVYPEAVWYGGVTLADVDEIVERHLVGGETVERLVIPDARLTGKEPPGESCGP